MAKRLTAKHLASTTQIRRGAVLAVAVAAATSLAVYTGTTGAGAAAAPTIGQVQAQVNSLQAKMDKIGQQYDAANQEYSSAQARLAQVQKQAASAQARYDAARAQLAAVAVSVYENSNQTSILGLLSSGNPAQRALPGVARPRGGGDAQRGGDPVPHRRPDARVRHASSGSAPSRASRRSARSSPRRRPR